MSGLAEAIALAATKFVNKYDKGGQPYILHCLFVMYKIDPSDHELMIIAVLHDIIEDTDVTLEDLREMGFSERVIAGVKAMTHEEGVSYMNYIKIIAQNPDARKAKRFDIDHNTRVLRMKGLRAKDFERLQKYFTAYEYLKD